MPMSSRLLRPRSAATGFDPRSIANLVAWFDASDASTITLNGSNVSQWRSKVGGWVANQGVAVSQPAYDTGLLGRPSVTFGSGQFLLHTATWANFCNNTTRETTQFYVVKQALTSTGQIFKENTTNNGHQLYAYYSLAGTPAFYDAGTQNGARVTNNLGTTRIATGEIITCFRNGGSVILSYGGRVIASRSNATGDMYQVASNEVYFGNAGTPVSFAVAMYYNRALSSLEQSAVSAYLSSAYGL